MRHLRGLSRFAIHVLVGSSRLLGSLGRISGTSRIIDVIGKPHDNPWKEGVPILDAAF
jgi:hypothetical protein